MAPAAAPEGGSFPWEANELKDHDLTVWPRLERQVWQTVRSRLGDPSTGLMYGDYSVAHPRSGDARPSGAPAYEKPRYTTAEHFLIGKGILRGSGEPSRMRSLGARIVAESEFRWFHRAGDLWLQDRADPDVPTNPGSPKVWVEKGHIQHLTFVADQLREQDA